MTKSGGSATTAGVEVDVAPPQTLAAAAPLLAHLADQLGTTEAGERQEADRQGRRGVEGAFRLLKGLAEGGQLFQW